MATPSIQRKLRLVIMLTSTTVLVMACAAFIVADRARASEILADDLASLAQIVGSNSAAPLTFDDRQAGTDVLSALKAKPGIVAAVMYTKDGRPFATYGSPDPSHLARVPAPVQTSGRAEVVREVFLGKEKAGSIYIASDFRDADARLRRFAGMAVVILIMALLVAGALSWRFERLITRPILDLAGAAQHVTQDRNYSIRVAAPPEGQPHDEIGALMIGFNEMLTGIQRRDGELHRHRNELEQQVETRTAELLTANGNLSAAKEIAERVAEMNAELGRQRQMILNAAGEGILGLDRKGFITFINPSGAALFGVPVDELVGRDLHELIHPDRKDGSGAEDCPICHRSMPAATRDKKIYTVRRADSVRTPFEYTASPIIDDAGWSGIVVTFRDITERLAVERMKDEFVSTVSHELRTPLTSIRGALGLFASGLLGTVSERAGRMLEIAVTNTDRLVRLINDILDLERMRSGKVELTRTSFDVAALMKEAVDGVQPVADGAGVRLTLNPLDVVLWADRDRIIQTLTNLLGNAVKFSPAGSAVVLTCAAEPEAIRFSVRDEGRGIPADKLDSIFERFKQVDASDSREKGGSGLGLAICRTVVAAHGGRIWAEPGPEKGSTFHFTIPQQSAADPDRNAAGAEVVALREPAGDAPSVLLVEDDLDLARVVTESLEHRGIRIVHATAGREAITASERDVPTLVILDLVLPDLDGFAVVEQMRADPTRANVPLVVFSAQEVSGADQDRLRLGPTTFFTKSRVSLEDFASCVTQLLATVTRKETKGAA